jgi:hypothetical protein
MYGGLDRISNAKNIQFFCVICYVLAAKPNPDIQERGNHISGAYRHRA